MWRVVVPSEKLALCSFQIYVREGRRKCTRSGRERYSGGRLIKGDVVMKCDENERRFICAQKRTEGKEVLACKGKEIRVGFSAVVLESKGEA